MFKSGLTKSMGNAGKALGLLALPFTFALVIALTALSSVAFAQAGATIYGYYTNAHLAGVPDGLLWLVNPASVDAFSPAGDLCANIYVLRSNQRTVECCSCKITPDSLVTLNVNSDLTSKPIDSMTFPPPQSGVIKIVSSAVANDGSCGVTRFPGLSVSRVPVAATSYAPSGGLGAWITHVNAAGTGTYSISEANFGADAVTTTALAKLQQDCLGIASSIPSRGICTCGTE